MRALQAEEGFATAPDGVRIFYRVSGKGPFALVMPVTWGMDSFVYTKGFSSLEHYLAIVTFDPRGVGRSEPVTTDEEYSMETAATDAAAVGDAIGVPRCVAIGHSGGGSLAMMYALRYPQRVSHLILLATAAWWSDPSPLRTADGLPETEEAMRKQAREDLARSVRQPEVFADAMEELLPRMRFSPQRLRWLVTAGAESYDVRKRLGEIRVPTLILHGRQDEQVPLGRADELHREIRGSRLIAIEGCGHWPHVENRLAFVDAVKEFLGIEDRPQKLF